LFSDRKCTVVISKVATAIPATDGNPVGVSDARWPTDHPSFVDQGVTYSKYSSTDASETLSEEGSRVSAKSNRNKAVGALVGVLVVLLVVGMGVVRHSKNKKEYRLNEWNESDGEKTSSLTRSSSSAALDWSKPSHSTVAASKQKSGLTTLHGIGVMGSKGSHGSLLASAFAAKQLPNFVDYNIDDESNDADGSETTPLLTLPTFERGVSRAMSGGVSRAMSGEDRSSEIDY
jgi:hypothetical protein